MTQEDVHNHAVAVLNALKTEHNFSNEQCRRVATAIVRMIGSLKSAKAADLSPTQEDRASE